MPLYRITNNGNATFYLGSVSIPKSTTKDITLTVDEEENLLRLANSQLQTLTIVDITPSSNSNGVDTTNAANITSGLLPQARLGASTLGLILLNAASPSVAKTALNLVPVDVGLGNVNNTADLDKPVSTATTAALALCQALSEKNQANGYLGLDSNAQVPTSKLPQSILGGVVYQTVWNAATNTPVLPAPASSNKGYYWKVSVSGNTNQSGITTWVAGDWIISNGAAYERVQTQDTVASVAGKIGTVILVPADVGLGNVNNTSDANKPVSTAQAAATTAAISTHSSAANAHATSSITGLDATLTSLRNDITALQTSTAIDDTVTTTTKTWSSSKIVAAIAAVSSGLNHPPTAVADTYTGSDTATTYTGNVLTNDSDADGDTLTLTTIAYNSLVKVLGTSFTTTYGSFIISSTGAWTFTLGTAAQALNSGQTGTEVFTYTITDGQGGNKSTTLTITINGTNQPPVAVGDYGAVPYNTVLTGNVLTNDSDPEGTSLTVVSFTVAGSSTVNPVGTGSVNVGSAGVIILGSNGAWTFTPTNNFSGAAPIITYSVSDGVNTSTAQLTLVIQGAVSAIVSNPVTTALTGTRTFNVGPGQSYTEMTNVPWSTMQPGDVVNIYYRSTPYVTRVGICVQATASAPFIINGVTDSNGNRPILTGANATTALGSMPGDSTNVFAAGDETYGVLTIKRRPSTATTTNPAWITIQNLEITGAASGTTAYNRDGSAGNWDFSAAIWCQPSSDITIQNNLMYGCGLGFFTQSKIGYGPQGSTGESTARVKLLYNRLYNNGKAGADTYHNVYIQAFNPLVEGNYIGPTIDGKGSSYKSRSSADIIRFNYIVCGARALDLVQPYDNNDTTVTDGISFASDFGIDHVYGNVIVDLNGTYRAIHYGGDNGVEGEQDPSSPIAATPFGYRKQLYFWNNTYYGTGFTSAQHFLFQISWPDTKVDAWNNVIGMYSSAGTTMCLTQNSGTINLRGVNVINVNTTLADSVNTATGYVTINRLGSVITTDPLWVSPSNQDYTLGAGSPALDVQSALPTGLPSDIGTTYKLSYYPRRQSNGLLIRPVIGNLDAGAMERDPNAPPASVPINTVAPTLDPSGNFVQGGTITALVGTWIYSPTSYAYQWQHYNTSTTVWDNIANATNASITLTSAQLGDVRCSIIGTNATGDSAAAYTNTRTIVSTPAATVVQHTSGHTIYPSQRLSAIATFTTAPTVGNTILAFLSGSNGATGNITDNFGNNWTRQATYNSGSGGICVDVYTCVVATGKTGANFAVTMANTIYDTSGIILHEVAGAFVGISSSQPVDTGNYPSDVLTHSINVTAVNQRIIGFLSPAVDYHVDAPTFSSPWIQSERMNQDVLIPVSSSYYGVSSQTGTNTLTQTGVGNGVICGFMVSLA